jgi:hypothetical protein
MVAEGSESQYYQTLLKNQKTILANQRRILAK